MSSDKFLKEVLNISLALQSIHMKVGDIGNACEYLEKSDVQLANRIATIFDMDGRDAAFRRLLHELTERTRAVLDESA